MKKVLMMLGLAGSLLACKATDIHSDYTYKNVPFSQVHFTDNFWAPRIETIRSVTVPYAFHKCEETHRIDRQGISYPSRTDKR